MELNAYLSFNGHCEAAFKFYERCLGGKIVAMLTYGGSPMEEQTPTEWRNKIMHARLVVGDKILMGSDAPPDRYEPMKGFSVSLGIDDPKDAERIFHALSEHGTVQMPIQKTFWAARFGMLVDQFGTPWMINCEPAGPSSHPAEGVKVGDAKQSATSSPSRPGASGTTPIGDRFWGDRYSRPHDSYMHS